MRHTHDWWAMSACHMRIPVVVAAGVMFFLEQFTTRAWKMRDVVEPFSILYDDDNSAMKCERANEPRRRRDKRHKNAGNMKMEQWKIVKEFAICMFLSRSIELNISHVGKRHIGARAANQMRSWDSAKPQFTKRAVKSYTNSLINQCDWISEDSCFQFWQKLGEMMQFGIKFELLVYFKRIKRHTWKRD